MKTKKPKSPSQKLRSVLYLVWYNNFSEEDFDTWYEKEIWNIIEEQKKRIDQSPTPELYF